MIKISIISLLFSIAFSSYYNVGDQMSYSHQNQNHTICYGSSDNDQDGSLSILEYNGAYNGGDYHVIMIDMSASW